AAINLSLNSVLNIKNSIIENCNARRNGGVFYFNNWEGTLNITHTEFKNNSASNNGGIINISEENVLEEAFIEIDNSTFINNNANLGGIIYIGTITSKFDVTKNLKITDSEFINNNANSGEILFISQVDQAKEILNSSNFDNKKVDSHPCNLSWDKTKLVTHMSDKKIIMSGDSISNGLYAYILSDTNRIYNIIDESTVDSLSNVMFVNATILDKDGKFSNDAIIIGDRETFCWSGICSLNSVKIYGKPGDYVLQIYVISNGGFISMTSKNITVDVTIENCNRTYNKDNLNIGYETCYDPVCISCVHGKYIDSKKCDICTCESGWKGDMCNKRYEYKYSLTLRIIFEIICVISALFSVFLIYGIWTNKKESIIRKSNPTFLIITVVGSLINYSTVIFYHGNRNSVLCTFAMWVKFIGFAVLYGLSSNKEFTKCTISETTILLYGLTIAMLIWGVYLALETSNLPEQFNEAKSIGISTYVYAFAMIVTEVIDNITDLNPDFNFLLMILSMLIYTWTSIFTIVVPKVYAIYSEWFVIFDILKRNVHGTENMVSIGKSNVSNDNFIENIDNNNVGGLSVIGK
ncbi:hypothetical protein PIROE2DRAFT_9040, partial [Piromyces sp. E2]